MVSLCSAASSPSLLFWNFLILLGLIFFLLYFTQSRTDKIRTEGCICPVSATVVRVKKGTVTNEHGPDSHFYTPVFSYRTADGKQIEISASPETSYSEDTWKQGQTVSLLINPEKPERYILQNARKSASEGESIKLFKIPSIVMLAIGIVLYFASIRY